MQACLSETKDIEIQPGFEPGPSELWSDALTNWVTGALAVEQRITFGWRQIRTRGYSTLSLSLVGLLDSAVIQTWHTGSEYGCMLIVHLTYPPCRADDGSHTTTPIRPTSQYYDEDQPWFQCFWHHTGIFYHKYSFSKRKTAATISACLVQEEQLVLYDHLPISVSE